MTKESTMHVSTLARRSTSGFVARKEREGLTMSTLICLLRSTDGYKHQQTPLDPFMALSSSLILGHNVSVTGTRGVYTYLTQSSLALLTV